MSWDENAFRRYSRPVARNFFGGLKVVNFAKSENLRVNGLQLDSIV